LNIRDVLSPYAQRKKRFHVESLERFRKESEEWLEAVVEDTRTPVPDQVAFRIDFPVWLQSQTKRNRRIAEALALGHTTGEVARQFKVSAGRVSQLRRQFCQSWQGFHGELAPAAA
jgi:DNA-binding NarL/FixJ family response regulator